MVGDWGFDRGTYHHTMTPKAGGAPISGNGKYLWLYQRQPDGSWKLSRVIWNSSDPPPPAVSSACNCQGAHDWRRARPMVQASLP